MKETQSKKIVSRKKLQGVVTKLSSAKTIKVEVENKFIHPKYQKIIKSHQQFLVHCEDPEVKIGDNVIIEEGSPKSHSKSFYLVKKV